MLHFAETQVAHKVLQFWLVPLLKNNSIFQSWAPMLFDKESKNNYWTFGAWIWSSAFLNCSNKYFKSEVSISLNSDFMKFHQKHLVTYLLRSVFLLHCIKKFKTQDSVLSSHLLCIFDQNFTRTNWKNIIVTIFEVHEPFCKNVLLFLWNQNIFSHGDVMHRTFFISIELWRLLLQIVAEYVSAPWSRRNGGE